MGNLTAQDSDAQEGIEAGMTEVLIGLMGTALLGILGYFGHRIVESVDRLNEKIAEVIGSLKDHDKRLTVLEERKEAQWKS